MRESGYYPAGAEFDPSAPYNQEDTPEKDFNVVCSMSLSKSVTVTTDDYIPGASGVDYEPDDEGGVCASYWHDNDDTSETNWDNVYHDNDHYTPIQLIQMFKQILEENLKEGTPIKSNRYTEHLIEECDNWVEDECEIFEEE